MPRSTRDIDLVAGIRHLETTTKVDVFVPKGDPLREAQMRRRQFVQVGATAREALPVLSPEDVILQATDAGLGERLQQAQDDAKAWPRFRGWPRAARRSSAKPLRSNPSFDTMIRPARR